MDWWYVANFLCCNGVKVADGNTESGVVAVPRRLLGCHDNVARVLPGSCLITAWKVNQPKPVFAEGEEEEETDEK